MHRFIAIILFATVAFAQTPQKPKARTLREVLLEQLHTTHDQEDWFVPIKIAVEGVTPEQAKWTDGKGNHSVGQLANHLAFWNELALEAFQGKPRQYKGTNDETFNSFDAKSWASVVKRLDDVMKAWERAVENADDAKLAEGASQIAHVGAHNAYHVGQIIYVRKLQGNWDPAKGVK